MKPRTLFILAALAILTLPSCAQIQGLLGDKVEIVNNRNTDGTFKPVREVTNSAGESPDASATVYHYPSGKLGVSGWYGGNALGAPQLSSFR